MRPLTSVAAWLAVLVMAVPGSLEAQTRPGPASSGPDFLFGAPAGSVSFRWNVDMHRGGSDWYDFVTRRLTLDSGDFSTPGLAGDVNVSLAPRFDLVFGASWGRRTTLSEYRDFVDDDRLPIEQQTRLTQAAFTGGVRYELLERGRTISSLAWVPRRFVPYVGGGGGILYYDLVQFGDFIDEVNFSIFPDRLPSNGVAPTGYVNGGLDIMLIKRLYLTVDGRYQWAAADLDEGAWRDFEPLDLSGPRFSTGISVLF